LESKNGDDPCHHNLLDGDVEDPFHRKENDSERANDVEDSREADSHGNDHDDWDYLIHVLLEANVFAENLASAGMSDRPQEEALEASLLVAQEE
jgi:hypothetical protein